MSKTLTRPPVVFLAIAFSVAFDISPRATTPAFIATGDMHIARAGHQATLLLDRRVLVSGGFDNAGNPVSAAELFNPATGLWTLVAGNVNPRMDHAAVRLLDGRVLVVGGAASLASCSPVETAEVYDPATDKWSLTSELPVAIGA